MTSTAALTVHSASDRAGLPFVVTFSARLDNHDDAEALAALFPKSAKFRASKVTGQTAPGEWGYVYSIVESRSDLRSVKGNERNETGIKRYAAIIKKAEALGIAVEWTTPYGNSIATREEFEALIAE